MSERPSRPFDLPARLRAIHEADYPRFSDAEMQRRRAAMAGLLLEAGLDHLVYCGANRFGSAVQWLTGRPGVQTPTALAVTGQPRRLASSRRAGRTRCSCNTSTTRR